MRLRRAHAGAFAVAFAVTMIDAVLGGHYGALACGIVIGGVNVWWWSR